MAMKVGDAVVVLGLDKKKFNQDMKGLGAQIKKHQKAIGIGMVALGGSILAAGALSVKAFAEMGDEVAKMSRKTGISTVTLSEWRHVAELSGTSLQGLEKATKRMATAIGDFQDGLMETKRDFDKLNISLADLEGLSPEEAFIKLGSAIAEVEDPLERAAIAQGIFGRAGMDLIPMFDQGIEAFKEMSQEAHDLGRVFSLEAAQKAEEFTDSMFRAKEAVSGVKMAIAEQLIPILIPMIDKVKDAVSAITAWTKEHPKLTKLIILSGTAFGVLLVGLGGLLLIMPGVTAAIALFGATLSAAIWPITIIVAAIAALGVAAFFLIKHWDAVSGFFKKAWSHIKQIFLQGVLNVLDSLSQFTKFIPGLNKKVDEAREKLSGMIESEKIGRDMLDLQQGMRETAEAIDKNREQIDVWKISSEKATTATRQHTDAIDDQLQALEDEAKELLASNDELVNRFAFYEDLLSQHEAAAKSVKDTRDEMEFERSEAGKLGITIEDVKKTLLDMGMADKELERTLVDLGEESTNVNRLMEAAGITALEVAANMLVQTGEVNDLAAAYAKLTDEIGEMNRALGVEGGGGAQVSAQARQLSEEQGMSPEAAQRTIDRYLLNPESPEFEHVREIMKRITGVQEGGIAMAPMLARIGEQAPRIPEAIIPLNKLPGLIGGVGKGVANIIIMLDSRVIGRKNGVRLMDEIIVKTGMKS